MMKSQNNTLRTLSLSFNLPIYARQIRQWRGAFIEMAGFEHDFFHNHDGGEGYHYRYPLIQYRIQRKHAAIFAINEGVDALQQVLANNEWKLNWEGEKRHLMIEDLRMQQYRLAMCDTPREYKLFNWLPLNSENYTKWLQCKNLIQRIELLEKILTNHLMAFVMSMNYQLPQRLEVDLQHLQQSKMVNCHGVPHLSFNINYTANIILPPKIAIGKAVSHGYGWQQPVHRREEGRKRGQKTISRVRENL